jgi:cell division septation protein DedD
MRRLMSRSGVFALACLPIACFFASTAGAQGSNAMRVSGPMNAAIARVRAISNTGDLAVARVLLDSLVSNAEPASTDLAEALYWRAVLSERAGDAERDWKRMTIESPMAPQVPDALMKLGDIEILRGRPPVARGYLERLLRDFDDAPQRPKAMLLIARSYFEERDTPRACATVETLRTSGVPEGEISLQMTEMRRRCTNAAAAAAAAATTPPAADPPAATESEATERPRSSSARKTQYAVQIAAYDSRAQAAALVTRLGKRGWKARIDGERKPYRVRVGVFDTRAEAAAMLARLKKQGQRGFVAELGK